MAEPFSEPCWRTHTQIVDALVHIALRLAMKYNRTASDTDPTAALMLYQVRSLEVQYRESGEIKNADEIKRLLDWWDAGCPQ